MIGPGHARPWPRLLVAALFAAFVVEQAPHLVHHLFEPGHAPDECAFLAGAERSQGAPAQVLALDAPEPTTLAVPASTAAEPPRGAIASPDVRAPPLVS
jgi:hypothetical protein